MILCRRKKVKENELTTELEEIEILKSRIKERSMIYQADLKESMARKSNVPLDSYYHLSYVEWAKIRDKKSNL